MPTHWTYAPIDVDDLFQGDILDRTADIEAILKECHPYFLEPKFLRFVVVTQSCDLVRRPNECKAEHISLAVVRELEPMLPDLIARIAGTEVPGIYRASHRFRAVDLLTKIINQNESSLGMFYLHSDGDIGIATPSVALLRITIALRKGHYQQLIAARRGRLTPEFRNKLGWLCGNLYSRIATPDWNEIAKHSEASKEQVERLLASIDGPNSRYWVPENWIEAAKNALGKDKSREDAISVLEKRAPPTPVECAVERVRLCAFQVLASESAYNVKAAVAEDRGFLSGCADHLASLIQSLIALDDASQIAQQFDTDAKFPGLISQSAFLCCKDLLSGGGTSDKHSSTESFLLLKVPRSITDLSKRICAKIFADQWESMKPALNSLAESSLFSPELAEALFSHLTSVLDTSQIGRIDKLVNRLKNDSQFLNLMKRPTEPSVPQTD